MKVSRILSKLPLLALMGMASGVLMAQTVSGTGEQNPHSPRYGHEYRHGVVPTREAHEQMKAWEQTNRAGLAAASKTLAFGGGVDGIGVTSGKPKVYLIVYGSQWGTASTDANGNMTLSNDAVGAVPYLQKMFKGLGTNNELWSGVMTQYCDGPLVAKGATTCPANAPHVGYPTGGAFAGIWYDNSVASPSNATGLQLAQEAIKAAAHFGNTTPASNRYAQYVILSPSGTHPDGFNTPSGSFCAWHDWNGDYAGATSNYGDIAFTNMPYVYDMGTSCGKGSVNGNTAQGNLDGFSIVEGHEYAETVTDQNPAGGWTNASSGQENADECSWISSGQGASANVVLSTGSFAMQSTWSNDTNRCDISHPIVTGGTGNTATPLTSGVPVTGIALSANTSKLYSIAVPAGRTTLTFKTTGGTGDADIYAKLGSAPTTTSYLKKSDGSTTVETITITSPSAGTYYLLLNAYSTFSGVTLTATY